MEEIWKPIENYDDYMISNLGNVKSYKRSNGTLLKPFIRGENRNPKNGHYKAVRLANGDGEKDFSIHRLVAKAFINNPNNLPQVNHINGNKEDNRVDNLEWCDNSYNIWHSYNVLNNSNGVSREVYQYTKDGQFINGYESILKASIELSIDNSSIWECCNKRRKSAGNFIWRYKGDVSDLIFKSDREKKVLMISKYLEVIDSFDSIRDASMKHKLNASNITGCCIGRRGFKTVGGYLWRYENDFDETEFSYYKDKVFIMMSPKGIIQGKYNGIKDVVDSTGYDIINIIKCCKGERTTAFNHKWELHIPTKEDLMKEYDLIERI